ncbi:MAG TPA: Ig-like domain-containing protein [Actinomycetota bacterium]|nr:Ig-like domain-containing protein [Actinomycetota bacterium]
MLMICATIGGAFAFFTTTNSSNPATAAAQGLPQGATPTLATFGTTVTVTFATVSTTGTPAAQVTNYNVVRYVSGTASSSPITGSCSTVGTTVACVDNAGTGSWQYTDTPVLANWTGQESAKSAGITVGAPPQVTSINRNDANPTKAATLHWTVTFNQPVVHVSTSNFSLATSGLTRTPSISLSPASGPATTYIVTATTSGVSGSGTIGLNLTSAGTIQNSSAQALAGPLPFPGQTYNFDNQDPSVAITQVNGNTVTFPFFTTGTVTSIGGTCGIATGDLITVTLTVSSPPQTGTTTCNAGGTWNFTLGTSLTATGSYTATASQADSVGNLGTATVTINIDRTAPTISLTQVNGATVTFPYATNATSVNSVGGSCGTASGDLAPVTVTITVQAQTGAANCASGSWTYTLGTPLTAQGTYTASASQSDSAGNVGATGVKTIIIDRTPPTATVTFPVTGTSYSIGNNGTNSWDGNSCIVNGVSGTMCGTAGDSGSGVATVQIAVFSATANKWWDGSFNLTTGAASFTLSTETFFTVAGTTAWSQTWNNLAFGPAPTGNQTLAFTVQAQSIDAAGNTSAPATVSFSVKK